MNTRRLIKRWVVVSNKVLKLASHQACFPHTSTHALTLVAKHLDGLLPLKEAGILGQEATHTSREQTHWLDVQKLIVTSIPEFQTS
jgi:hypothetical protein